MCIGIKIKYGIEMKPTAIKTKRPQVNSSDNDEPTGKNANKTGNIKL